ncbi:hypothetical protein M434DRAFT_188749 [Hypoxylon sp. CO27-5]|nr:hypothetical protein M434DRAFT_188749 [Hypoxylon sp. CO27-5]
MTSRDSAVDGRPRNGTENPIELSDITPDTLPSASTSNPGLRPVGSVSSKEPEQTRYSSSGSNETTQRLLRKKDRKALGGRTRAEALGWVDKDYYEENPWYGQDKKKPIFSLGKPLPHKVRWAKKPADLPTRDPPKSSEDLAERGEVDPNNVSPLSNVETRETTASQASRARRTAAGVSHSGRRNDADQPVFEYIPEQDKPDYRRERTTDTHDTDKSDEEDNHNFGIDSEPLGQREREEVEKGDRDPDEFRNWWARIRAKHPEPLAEFLAVCFSPKSDIPLLWHRLTDLT